MLEELFKKRGYRGDESFVRARILYFHQIGYYALAMHEDLAERIRLVPIYYEALTGKKPGPELDNVIDFLQKDKRRPRLR